MRRAIISIIGYSLAPIFVFTVWGEFVEVWGVIGGWFAGLAVIGPMWFLLHYNGLVEQESDAAFVDLGLAVGVGGIFQGVFSGLGMAGLIGAMPTIIVVVLGAIAGGFAAGMINKTEDKS